MGVQSTEFGDWARLVLPRNRGPSRVALPVADIVDPRGVVTDDDGDGQGEGRVLVVARGWGARRCGARGGESASRRDSANAVQPTPLLAGLAAYVPNQPEQPEQPEEPHAP